MSDIWAQIEDELIECRRREYDDPSWERYIGGVMARLWAAVKGAPAMTSLTREQEVEIIAQALSGTPDASANPTETAGLIVDALSHSQPKYQVPPECPNGLYCLDHPLGEDRVAWRHQHGIPEPTPAVLMQPSDDPAADRFYGGDERIIDMETGKPVEP